MSEKKIQPTDPKAPVAPAAEDSEASAEAPRSTTESRDDNHESSRKTNSFRWP